MKTDILCATSFCVLITLAFSGCNFQGTEHLETSLVPVSETTVTQPAESRYEGLGLTEGEIRMLEDRGVANVGSVEAASKIAGFPVAVPVYVPDGFKPRKFAIQISGAGMPSGMSVKFNNTKVDCVYTNGDGQTIIVLTQSTHKFSVGGSEPTVINGQPAERAFTPADPANSQTHDKLTFGWEKDGFYFAITGTLSEYLDEVSLVKMACSIGIE